MEFVSLVSSVKYDPLDPASIVTHVFLQDQSPQSVPGRYAIGDPILIHEDFILVL